MAVDEDACMSWYSPELFFARSGLDGRVTAVDRRNKMRLYVEDKCLTKIVKLHKASKLKQVLGYLTKMETECVLWL